MTALASRKALVVQGTSDNAGLLFSRYLPELGDEEKKAVPNLLRDVARCKAAPAYEVAFKRWKAFAEARAKGKSPSCITFEATLAAPLAIGLGTESMTEVGLTTHYTYGMPTIPGSALKGLCRSAATEFLKGDDKHSQIETLFGKLDSASFCVFWDAWYVPDSVGGTPFHRDTITVHHPAYYRGDNVWPTDFDDPNPIPFLVIKPGARFLFTIDTPAPEWNASVKNMASWSLSNLGIGGKTNAGYGYFQELPAEKIAERETWFGVHLSLNPSSGTLSTSSGQNKATASGTTASDLQKSLPEAIGDRLRKKKSLPSVDVRVEKKGNLWQIVELLKESK